MVMVVALMRKNITQDFAGGDVRNGGFVVRAAAYIMS
jgi:hypothetical protein